MTGLFFAVDPVWWIGSIDTYSILLSLALGALLGLFFFAYHRLSHISIPHTSYLIPHLYTPIDPTHPDYAKLTLSSIRQYLEGRYSPHHTTAHTPQDIASYVSDSSLIDIIRRLEHSEYTHSELPQGEKETLNRELCIKLKV